MKRFPIFCAEKTVGYASLEKQGMFYKLRCYCDLPQDQQSNIIMTVNKISVDLGICARVEKGIGMVTRIPCSILTDAEPVFTVKQEQTDNQTIYAVSEDSAFPALEGLAEASFIRKEGKAYICMP